MSIKGEATFRGKLPTRPDASDPPNPVHRRALRINEWTVAVFVIDIRKCRPGVACGNTGRPTEMYVNDSPREHTQ